MTQHNEDNATRPEAAKFLRVTPRTLAKWERLKVGPPMVRVSKRVALYPWECLRAFVKVEAAAAVWV